MSFFYLFIILLQILSAFAVVLFILLQNGNGSDIGSSFGSGSAFSVFGSSGSANFLSKSTKWFAIIFFVSTLSLSYLNNKSSTDTVNSSVMESVDNNAILENIDDFLGKIDLK
ncbi:preprotein translocase subunit SecG [Candidatus Kinetoplastibacterium oncopeltii TCC290E]|uniref:Protein-export membrane protein SecG n=1 Tax=Candidatus Kinetoplastidibacterium stringomonadis TCC290E TaxID=1208920 RepID=M1M945_9PROT|nr:preprotein translocase subunit SecG [Candidatus Kinetoplastibacterium oncopeltii]AGF48495.1 preprotein translocase subunit SecG [Candidatus Kinetoplastibacterium oncopeltii TCC290E]